MRVVYRGPRNRLVVDGFALYRDRVTEVSDAYHARVSKWVEVVAEEAEQAASEPSQAAYDVINAGDGEEEEASHE